ncbi:MAG: AbrB/MazE/SpoVT family DNA-binding domain-containing protein [Erysipelothrix sp.]|nr:AbrB/MazE/SpoVT family DNA-binding domain-containing protein [Erysipelothrix sp.]
MKNSGINRRIDDLGRIVIPRDIRDHFRVKSGDTFEIFIEDEKIVLRKFSPISKKLQHLVAMCEVLEEEMDTQVMFYYDGVFIDPRRKVSVKDLPIKTTTAFEKILADFHPTSFNDVQIFVDSAETLAGYTYPIINEGNILGVFVIFKQLAKLDEKMLNALSLCEQLLLKQI